MVSDTNLPHGPKTSGSVQQPEVTATPGLSPMFTAGYNSRQQEVDELRAEVERWKIATTSERERGDRAVARAVKAEAEVERLRAALQVYADEYEGNELARETLGLPPMVRKSWQT